MRTYPFKRAPGAQISQEQHLKKLFYKSFMTDS